MDESQKTRNPTPEKNPGKDASEPLSLAQIERIRGDLRYLKLNLVCESFDELVLEPSRQRLKALDLLADLIDMESSDKRARAVERRIAQARMPLRKSLADFKFSHPKRIDKEQIQNIFRLKFVQEKENVVFMGPCGVGKTHLAIALSEKLCQAGHSVLFAKAADLADELLAATQAGKTSDALRKYAKPSILVLDEFGLVPFGKSASQLFFRLVSARHERSPLILTTTVPFSSWANVFNDDASIASAVVDRVACHSHIVLIDGESYRMSDRRQR